MRTLASTIKPGLTPFHEARVNRIDAEDFSVVRRKVREEMIKHGEPVSDDFLDEGVLALKQYYVVALLDPKNQHAVSDVIDPFWHFHILDSKNYFRFGEKVFGQYIHHTPLDHSDPVEVTRVRSLYDYTTRVYHEMFNYVNPGFYPAELTDERLICFHNTVEAREVNTRHFTKSNPCLHNYNPNQHYSKSKTASLHNGLPGATNFKPSVPPKLHAPSPKRANSTSSLLRSS